MSSYGRDPPSLLHYVPGTATDKQVDQLVIDREAMLSEIKFHLEQAQDLTKLNFDHRRRELTFETGDQVYVKLRPYRKHLVLARSSRKLSPKYAGPFTIVRHIGEVAYELQFMFQF